MSEIWQHKKTQSLYVIISSDVTIEKTMEEAVVYKSLTDGRIWVRPCSEFYDGRFKKLNKIKTSEEGLIISRSEEF